MKCDVIIPVYKAPEWVKLCVYALFANTDKKLLGKVFLINDCDDPFTASCLKNLKAKYGNKIVVKQNEKNLGFIKTVNRGIELSSEECVLLLNSDCLLAKNTIGKLMGHLEKDPEIGLICPLASNAANLTLPMPEGFNYTQMDALLERHFAGESFDACTVVGNCLMVTRSCIEKTGKLDESYGTGYGEETDYQFKAMQKGFKAKVAIDTYVFHKAEASFGTSKEKQAKLQKNRDLFFSRWGEEYKAEMEKYNKNDPIKYINSRLSKSDWQAKADTLFYIDGVVQNAGGVHVVVDIINYLAINGRSINMLYNLQYPYQESMLFTPVSFQHISRVETKQIVSTVWKTAFAARKIADGKNLQLLSFVQGYEGYFENGTIYGNVETSYKLADRIMVISKYLHRELKQVFDRDSEIVVNGINYDLLHGANRGSSEKPVITIILRDNSMKGDWILMDLVKRLGDMEQPVKINLLAINGDVVLPAINNQETEIALMKGPQNRNTVYQLLQSSDIYVDASLSEGFGLTALEAMAAGCVPIASDSLGINEYIKNGQNGIVVKNVNNAGAYFDAVQKLIGDKDTLAELRRNGQETAKDYDFDDTVPQYIEFFEKILSAKSQKQPLTEQDLKNLGCMNKEEDRHARRIKAFEIVKKITPKPVKYKAVEAVNKLYRYINR